MGREPTYSKEGGLAANPGGDTSAETAEALHRELERERGSAWRTCGESVENASKPNGGLND